jgi:hypothetical protein
MKGSKAQSVSLQDLLAEADRIDGETALELERTRMAKTAISSRMGSSHSRRSRSRAGSTAAAETANRRPPSEMLSSCPSSRPRSVSIGFSNSFRPASTTCGEMGWWERPATAGSAAFTSRSRKSKQDVRSTRRTVNYLSASFPLSLPSFLLPPFFPSPSLPPSRSLSPSILTTPLAPSCHPLDHSFSLSHKHTQRTHKPSRSHA